jgi:hypothetical protein
MAAIIATMASRFHVSPSTSWLWLPRRSLEILPEVLEQAAADRSLLHGPTDHAIDVLRRRPVEVDVLPQAEAESQRQGSVAATPLDKDSVSCA